MFDIKFASVTLDMKDLFFDRQAVKDYIGKTTARVFRWAGGYIRVTAKNSIKTEKNPFRRSHKGNPPYSRTGKLKQRILYYYDRADQDVIVGPMLFRSGDIPGVLEYGGPSTIWKKGKGMVPIMVKERPYMRPALEKGIEKLPDFWAQAIR